MMPTVKFEEDGFISLQCQAITRFGTIPVDEEQMTLEDFEMWLYAMLQECKNRREQVKQDGIND